MGGQKKKPQFSIKCTTEKGGAVTLNAEHGVWCSYAVATVGDCQPPELFYAGLTLPDGQALQFFVNRETGLVVVDLLHRDDKNGRELLRVRV